MGVKVSEITGVVQTGGIGKLNHWGGPDWGYR